MLLSGNWSVRLPCIIRSIFSYKLQEKILFTLIQTSAAFFLFLNTLTFSMLYLCKVTTVCHSIRNADQNKPNKKNVCECWTQQSGNEDSELPERICTKFSLITINKWQKFGMNFHKTTSKQQAVGEGTTYSATQRHYMYAVWSPSTEFLTHLHLLLVKLSHHLQNTLSTYSFLLSMIVAAAAKAGKEELFPHWTPLLLSSTLPYST